MSSPAHATLKARKAQYSNDANSSRHNTTSSIAYRATLKTLYFE